MTLISFQHHKDGGLPAGAPFATPSFASSFAASAFRAPDMSCMGSSGISIICFSRRCKKRKYPAILSIDTSPNAITTATPALAPTLSPAGGMPVVAPEEEFDVFVIGVGETNIVDVELGRFHPLSWTAAIFVADAIALVVMIQLCESSWTA
jgi:hypothetical protein